MKWNRSDLNLVNVVIIVVIAVLLVLSWLNLCQAAPTSYIYQKPLLENPTDAARLYIYDPVTNSDRNLTWGLLRGLLLPPAPAWSEITGKPLYFTPAAHNQAIGTITGLQSALDASSTHAADANNPHQTTAAQVGAVPDTVTINGYPLVPPSDEGAISDDFSIINNNRWIFSSTLPASSTTTIVAGKLHYTAAVPLTVSATSKLSLAGDFDVNWSGVNNTGSNGYTRYKISLGVNSSVYVQQGPRFKIYKVVNGATTELFNEIAGWHAGNPLNIRMVRAGNTITIYESGAANWVQSYSLDWGTAPDATPVVEYECISGSCSADFDWFSAIVATLVAAPVNISLYASDLPGLATVATSGSYTDLANQPAIPAAQVNSDWNAATGLAQILNKPAETCIGRNSWDGLDGAVIYTVAGAPASGLGIIRDIYIDTGSQDYYRKEGEPAAWVLKGNIQGASGTLAIGSVTTVAYTAPATITNSGTATAAVWNVEIPAGAPGLNGSPDTPTTIREKLATPVDGDKLITQCGPTETGATTCSEDRDKDGNIISSRSADGTLTVYNLPGDAADKVKIRLSNNIITRRVTLVNAFSERFVSITSPLTINVVAGKVYTIKVKAWHDGTLTAAKLKTGTQTVNALITDGGYHKELSVDYLPSGTATITALDITEITGSATYVDIESVTVTEQAAVDDTLTTWHSWYSPHTESGVLQGSGAYRINRVNGYAETVVAASVNTTKAAVNGEIYYMHAIVGFDGTFSTSTATYTLGGVGTAKTMSNTGITPGLARMDGAAFTATSSSALILLDIYGFSGTWTYLDLYRAWLTWGTITTTATFSLTDLAGVVHYTPAHPSGTTIWQTNQRDVFKITAGGTLIL